MISVLRGPWKEHIPKCHLNELSLRTWALQHVPLRERDRSIGNHHINSIITSIHRASVREIEISDPKLMMTPPTNQDQWQLQSLSTLQGIIIDSSGNQSSGFGRGSSIYYSITNIYKPNL
ncbi:hypothetical protein FGO68_gene14137 [Halteria grandinella]|uniref:Uncharacterized protein n=1 Tax=Halteria grandinella TaxID=5974 RepID=A0A8J8NUX2_HALGN|nr:hypothetical protein FGO68_gene14137 [Halteria grandinella]